MAFLYLLAFGLGSALSYIILRRYTIPKKFIAKITDNHFEFDDRIDPAYLTDLRDALYTTYLDCPCGRDKACDYYELAVKANNFCKPSKMKRSTLDRSLIAKRAQLSGKWLIVVAGVLEAQIRKEI